MLQLPQLEITSHDPGVFNVRNVDKGEFVAMNIKREDLVTWWMYNAANHLQRVLQDAEQGHVVSYLPEL